jgi:hypothetical protein
MANKEIIFKSIETANIVIDHWQNVIKKDPNNKKASFFLARAQRRLRTLNKINHEKCI